jgi:hypothetical protein
MYEREVDPWPFPNKVTNSICILAGRDASTALYVALGKHKQASAAHEAMFYQPFTYWDWQGVSLDDACARENIRHCFVEYHRESITNRIQAPGCLSSIERWQSFAGDIENNPQKGRWVKKIAVANWMQKEHLCW